MKSHARVTGIKATFPTGQESLLVQIDIDCPECGTYRMTLAGHHLRMVRDALIEMIDLHPGLTGRDADVQTEERFQFETPITKRPQDN